jgi:hypothetical protein
MTEQQQRDALLEGMEKLDRRMKRDKKYALEHYVALGMMTRKGNLTRPWQQLRKLYGIIPRHYHAIRRAGVTC